MKTAKIFRSGRSQAVRLPKEFRFNQDEDVYIKKVGSVVMLIPRSVFWETFKQACQEFTPDFMAERVQPPQQERPPLD